jgi:16S rRNA (guanine527-N7)-methyltransferase
VKAPRAWPAPEGDLELLCKRYGLEEEQCRQLAGLLAHVAREERAPTTVREPADAVRVHLADSLVALELDLVRRARTIVDMGAGAGFPGLPLAVALPDAEMSLVESRRGKCIFIEGACHVAQVRNAAVVCTRVEEWRGGVDGHELVLARALAPQSVVLEYAAPLLRRDGALVDWRGRRDSAAETAAAHAAEELGLRLREIRRVIPYQGAREHHLHIWTKTGPTPARFPRRAGVARKRPLGC